MSSPSHITVRKCKFNDTIKSEWEGELLPSLHSDWSIVLHHPNRHSKVTQTGQHQSSLLFLHCFNHTQPLSILLEYSLNGQFRGAKCDAILSVTHKDMFVEFIDLDLDVIVESDLSYYVRDEKEFAENRQKMGYSDSVVEQARNGIAFAKSLVTLRQFPFNETFVPTLDMMLEF